MLKLISLLLCSVTLGCSSTLPPVPQFQSSKLKNSFEEAVSVEVTFNLLNNNPEAIHLVRFKYTVLIDGEVVYEGLKKAEQTLPYSSRGETASSTIPIVIPRSYLEGKEEVTWHMNGSLQYVANRALAETLFESNLWQPTIAFVASDSLEVPPIEWILGY